MDERFFHPHNSILPLPLQQANDSNALDLVQESDEDEHYNQRRCGECQEHDDFSGSQCSPLHAD